MNEPRIETAEVGRAMGQVLADRNTWRHAFNRVRILLDLPALTSERCSAEDGDVTYEHARMCKRDSEHLVDAKQRLREQAATIERMREQAREDGRTINSLRAERDNLEQQIYALTGGAS